MASERKFGPEKFRSGVMGGFMKFLYISVFNISNIFFFSF